MINFNYVIQINHLIKVSISVIIKPYLICLNQCKTTANYGQLRHQQHIVILPSLCSNYSSGIIIMPAVPIITAVQKHVIKIHITTFLSTWNGDPCQL